MTTLNLGDVFAIRTPPNGYHYFTSIAQTIDLETLEDQYLFVSFSSFYEKCDKACVIDPGEEDVSFLSKKTFVDYSSEEHILLLTINEFVLMIVNSRGRGDIKNPDHRAERAVKRAKKGACSPELLSRIQFSAEDSEKMSKAHKRIVSDHLKNISKST
jgi:hypothetical protein